MPEQIAEAEWLEKGRQLYGDDPKEWKFRCVQCGEVQTGCDFVEAEIDDAQNKVYYSCIGRWVDGRGCDWTLGGLFQIHKREVILEDDDDTVPVFLFADEPEPETN